MSYGTGEAAILTKVRTCTGFTSANSSRMNWKLMSQGASDHYAILKPGEASFTWAGFTLREDHYQTVIELWQRYTDETTSFTNLYGYVDNLLALFSTPHMGTSTILDSNIRSWKEPEEMWNAGGNGPAWLRWRLIVEWSELTTVSFSE